MKKRLVSILTAMILMCIIAGCGNRSEEPAVQADTTKEVKEEAVVTSTEEVKEEVVVTPTEEVKEEVVVTPTEELLIKADEEDKLNEIKNSAEFISKIEDFSEYVRTEEIKMYKITENNESPYFIGRDSYEDNINFFSNNMEEGDHCLYLGLPMYLPAYVSKDTVYVTVDNEEIAKIEGNELIGLKQGVFVLYCYNINEELIESKKFVCSTYNDSKENLGSLMSIKTEKYSEMKEHWNMNDIEYWEDNVKTIMDMSYMLQVRDFKYSFEKEPKLGVIDNCGEENAWNWMASAETIFDNNGGVCIQVAQLACYMLAGDYEDWGVVLVEGKQGHIFNWFFEDGYYYIFDYTEVISDNAWNKSQRKYWDYSNKVEKFETIDQIKEWIVNEKVETAMNYLVYMYSCLGHNFIACNLNTGMSNSYAVTDGTTEKVIIGYQTEVMDSLEVLYMNPNSSEIEFVSYDDVNDLIVEGVYFDNDTMKYYHSY